MKVLGIVCSPRKEGNTEIMMKEALTSAREAGAETELVLIADKKIGPCDACSSCFKTTKCHIKDDMQEIYEKIDAADGIILGTPVYFGTVTAQCKAVMDRTFCYLPALKLKGKVAASILAVRRIGGGQTRNLLYGFFMVHGMVPVKGAIGYARQKGEVLEAPGSGVNITALEEARIVGTDIVQMIRRMASA